MMEWKILVVYNCQMVKEHIPIEDFISRSINDIFPNKHKFEGVCQMARLILTGFVVQNVRFDFSVSDGLQLLVIFPRAVLNGFAPYMLFCKNPRWKYTEFADTCVMNSSCFLKITMTAGENSSNGILAYCI